MCGIAGCVLQRGAEPDRDALARMAGALRHRGPDDHGIETLGSVGLVHTRLAIVDPSPAGHQPMVHPTGRWWISYNGEVFNHLELRADLGDHTWRGGSDTETVLHALAAWGDGAVARCNGLFAFAALDCDRRRLLLVRDRFGVKPLYVARHAGGLWFASEMKALLAAGVPAAPAVEVAKHAVAFSWANGPQTPVAAITRVMPGTLLTIDIDTGGVTEREWYSPVRAVDPELARSLARTSRPALRQRLEEELRASVRRRLMADVPTGTMCSGGVDSSLVAAFARDEHPRIEAFNASLCDQPENDEGPWAERVAEALGIDLHTVRADAASWRRDLVETVLHTEYPLTHESSVPMSQIAALARDRGVKVLLSGEGADELLGGYEWANATLHRAFALRRDPVQRARICARNLASRVVRGPPVDLRGEPAVAVTEFQGELARRACTAYSHHRGSRRALEASCLGLLGTYLPHLLNRQDKNTMQRSVETRVPFLDPGVVSLALNLPLEARVEPRRKEILRELADRHLPAGVADRPKIGFGFDVRRYLEGHTRSEFLLDGHLRELWNVPAGPWADGMSTLDSHGALRFWTGEIWARGILAGDSRETIESALWRGG